MPTWAAWLCLACAYACSGNAGRVPAPCLVLALSVTARAALMRGAHATQVNHEAFHRMLEEYRVAKKREQALELKSKQ